MPILCEKTTRKYYFPATEKCAGCQRQFKHGQVGVVRIIQKLGTAIFCEKCIIKAKKVGELASQQLIATATCTLIKDSFVVNESKLEVHTAPKSLSTFEFAQMEGKTIDRTRYAKSNAMKMDLPQRKSIEEIDYTYSKNLSAKELREILTDSKPVGISFDLIEQIIPKSIEYKKQKQLGLKIKGESD